MRIAFLTHEPFYPPSGGGSAEAAYLVQELVRRGLHRRQQSLDDPVSVPVEPQSYISSLV